MISKHRPEDPGGPIRITDSPVRQVVPPRPWHRWQDWVNLALGVWLFFSPWVWDAVRATPANETGTGWDAWLVGIVIILSALGALAGPNRITPEAVNALAGVWLFLEPFVLIEQRAAEIGRWNHWVVGVVVFALSVWAIAKTNGRRPRPGGPWPGGSP